ncbi:MAG: hypothetical protein EOM20_10745 [Spartobacteria bacterium]|nr:hypothetical protein [Spartobacteria bacterium]
MLAFGPDKEIPMKLLTILSAALFALTISFVSAGEILVDFDFADGQVSFRQDGPYDIVELQDGILPETAPGTPWLPARFVNILLPPGSTFVGVEATGDSHLLKGNVTVFPAQPPQSPSLPQPPFVMPLPAAYASGDMMPAALAVPTGTHRMRGRTFVSVRLNAVQYLPARKEVFLNQRIQLRVEYTDDPKRRAATSPADSALFDDMVNTLVVNPSPPARQADYGTNTITYVVVTTRALTNAFQEVADHRTTLFGAGRTAVADLESIVAQTPGVDDPDRLRNYIRNLVASNNTEYIVLGGDDTVVPVRVCRVSIEDEVEPNMPTDLYYAGLDGTWDANGDGIYGEPDDDVDMAPDVIVSRVPVRTVAQAEAYIHKLITYETLTEDPLAGKLFVTGTKAWNKWTGDMRGDDEVYDGYAQFRAHQPVSDVEQWSRRLQRDSIYANWPARQLDVFFDTLTSWDQVQAGDYEQTTANMVEKYNHGYDHHWYFTHGGQTSYALDHHQPFAVTNAFALTNVVRFIATAACLTGHFDGSPDPCLSEAFLRNPDGGALIYNGCSRYGLGEAFSLRGGPSGEYAYQYYLHLFDDPGSNFFGTAFALSKAALIGLCSDNGMYRWLQFGLNLQGDTAIPVTPSPFPMAPVLESAVMVTNPLGIRLDWADMADDENGFEIQRRDATGQWSPLAGTSVNVTNYTDNTVLNNQFYTYRVRATNAAGHSLWSNEGGLIAGILAADGWDPGDNSVAGATPLPLPAADGQTNGPHTLSIHDTNDWFRIDMQAGYAYWFSTYSAQAAGGLYAQLYADADLQVLLAADGDMFGGEQFSIYYAATNTGPCYLRIRPNGDLDSAHYNLFYREAINQSSAESLGEALNATSLVWSTSVESGDPWFAQTNVSHDSESAAQSGPVYYNETSWIETTFHGIGSIGWWWKTSSQTNRDFISVRLNGLQIETLSGETDWTHASIDTEFSTNVIRWEFTRSATGSEGDNAAWLDRVTVALVEDGPWVVLGEETRGTCATAGQINWYRIEAPSGLSYMFIPIDGGDDLEYTIFDGQYNELDSSDGSEPMKWSCRETATNYLKVAALTDTAPVDGEYAFLIRKGQLTPNDFDGDDRTDLAVFNPTDGMWYIHLSESGEAATLQWGWAHFVPVTGNYDGEEGCNIGVYGLLSGDWYLYIDDGEMIYTNWGWGSAIPVQADYDGDGKTDIAVYWPETGAWYINQSSDGRLRMEQWGWSEAKPVPADYDGDGCVDPAVYHSERGDWFIQESAGQARMVNWGWEAVVPVPADYDGDSLTDVAVYWPDEGMWFLLIDGETHTIQFGWDDPIPLPADYTGDWCADLALYHRETGMWYVLDSETGATYTHNWGWEDTFNVFPQYWMLLLLW